MPLIDEIARERAIGRSGLPPCLHVPIAAVDEEAINSYVGTVVKTLSGRGTRRAFLVEPYDAAPIDLNFPIWDNAASSIFHHPAQVWVHIGYQPYRAAYRRGFPSENIDGLVLSHAMNRRVASLKGFDFVRITPTSRAANSSSAFSEQWGVALYTVPDKTPHELRQGCSIAYADLAELMLMMDMNLGGGVMDAVNDGQKLIRPRAQS